MDKIFEFGYDYEYMPEGWVKFYNDFKEKERNIGVKAMSFCIEINEEIERLQIKVDGSSASN